MLVHCPPTSPALYSVYSFRLLCQSSSLEILPNLAKNLVVNTYLLLLIPLILHNCAASAMYSKLTEVNCHALTLKRYT